MFDGAGFKPGREPFKCCTDAAGCTDVLGESVPAGHCMTCRPAELGLVESELELRCGPLARGVRASAAGLDFVTDIAALPFVEVGLLRSSRG